ncbi:MAG: hypothetical protein ACTSWV_00225 [Candidatus Asgardarchaeia archaeon]
MSIKFVLGGFNNFYSERSIKKNKRTLALFEDCFKEIVKMGWSVSSVWVNTPSLEKHTDSIEEAIGILEGSSKGSIFVTVKDKKNKEFFVRWYDSDPQSGILSIEAPFLITEDSVSLTPVEDADELVRIFQENMLDKVALEDTKEVSPEYKRSQESGVLGKIIENVRGRSKDDV